MVVIVLMVGCNLLLEALTIDTQDLLTMEVLVKLLTDSVASERIGSSLHWKTIVDIYILTLSYIYAVATLFLLS